MIRHNPTAIVSLLSIFSAHGFSVPSFSRSVPVPLWPLSAAAIDDPISPPDSQRQTQKETLLHLLGISDDSQTNDSLWVDPLTKEPLSIHVTGPLLAGAPSAALSLRSGSDRVFTGRTDSYINLLEPISNATTSLSLSAALLALAPPPLRPVLARALDSQSEYIPMRDLFTSPSVSFAYERGWRQGFLAAGFPGVDKEFDMARSYFDTPARPTQTRGIIVDMSCATGLFTRRFAKCQQYSRVIGCDYSDAMLREARARIRADSEVSLSPTRLDLVRCDVAHIPLKTSSIDGLHAGAAMHCWPEIELSLKEIHRVLVPGGRFFATTFLSTYFQRVSRLESVVNGGQVGTSIQAFQYFPSVEFVRKLMVEAGFEEEKVEVQLLGRACVVVRCEK